MVHLELHIHRSVIALLAPMAQATTELVAPLLALMAVVLHELEIAHLIQMAHPLHKSETRNLIPMAHRQRELGILYLVQTVLHVRKLALQLFAINS